MTSLRLLFGIVLASAFVLSGCAGAQKQREAQRKELSASSGFYCEFLSGDKYPDIDVALNLELAKKCDSTKHYTITNFKNAADNYGIVYCCSMTAAAKKEEKKMTEIKLDSKPEPKVEAKPDAKGKAPVGNDKSKDAGDILPE